MLDADFTLNRAQIVTIFGLVMAEHVGAHVVLQGQSDNGDILIKEPGMGRNFLITKNGGHEEIASPVAEQPTDQPS